MASNPVSAWAAKRSGNLNQFYTRPDVGRILARAFGEISPRVTLDLGAGEGSLTAAVAERWPDIHAWTVDIDQAAGALIARSLGESKVSRHSHVTADVFDLDLPDVVGDEPFDLAVCNPPFYRPDWEDRFGHILGAAELTDACPSKSQVTAEILFLAQILRLVREGGRIALIVPSGLATGWKWHSFRKSLLKKHALISATQLPPYSFTDTEAYCFILIIEKSKPKQDAEVSLTEIGESGEVISTITVSRADAEVRLDCSYHKMREKEADGSLTLRGLDADVRRGSFSTVQRRAADFDIFHTGDFPAVGETVSLGGGDYQDHSEKVVVAEAGDILMARVDRYLHDKITMVASGSAPITDCVYRIRLPAEHREKAFAALSSQDGRERLKSRMKGVGARLIGKAELLDLSLPEVG